MVRRAAVATLLALIGCGYAAAAVAKEPSPFEYRFQVTSVVETSTFVLGDATAVTKLRLAALPKAKSLDWYGKGSPFGSNGTAFTLLHLTGTITYNGLDRAECNGTFQIDSARWPRPVYAGLALAFFDVTKISVGAGGFPFGSVYRRPNGGCENGATRFWLNVWPKPDTGPGDYLALSIVRKPGFSVANTYSKRFDDGSSVNWSVAMTARRIHYRAIDCAHTQWC